MSRSVPRDELRLYLCPLCHLLMTPPGRTPLTMNCGHTACEQCLSAQPTQTCLARSQPYVRTVHAYLLTELIATYISSNPIDTALNPPSFDGPVPAMRGVCTCAIHGKDPVSQPRFHCRTCNLLGNLGCCEVCARFCHRGHDVVTDGTSSRCLCDCGDGQAGACQALTPPPPVGSTCSRARTGKCNCHQQTFECVTCHIVEEKGICEVCARICHAGHTLRPVEDGRRNFCACPDSISCKCCPKAAGAPHCTFVETRRIPISQRMWKCRSCTDLADRPICEHCAKACHSRHIVEPLGDVEGYCRCGIKCTITPAARAAPQPRTEHRRIFDFMEME
jgi:hypothetical protein